jgi:flagellar biosynthetic protein FliR
MEFDCRFISQKFYWGINDSGIFSGICTRSYKNNHSDCYADAWFRAYSRVGGQHISVCNIDTGNDAHICTQDISGPAGTSIFSSMDSGEADDVYKDYYRATTNIYQVIMDLLTFSPEQIKAFILIFIRVSIVLFLLPIFGSNIVQMRLKAGLALIIAVILCSVIRPDINSFPETLLSTVNLILSECVIGMIIGLMIRMFFSAVQLAGQLIGFQMGFAIINVLDPQTGTQASIIAQFGYWIVVLVFLLLNGHHLLLNGLKESFDIINVGSIRLNQGLFQTVVAASSRMFLLAIKIGAPAIAALLFVSAAFGICAKFAPQMNILIVAFPIKIVVGLIFFGLSLQILLRVTKGYLGSFDTLLINIMNLMKV